MNLRSRTRDSAFCVCCPGPKQDRKSARDWPMVATPRFGNSGPTQLLPLQPSSPCFTTPTLRQPPQGRLESWLILATAVLHPLSQQYKTLTIHCAFTPSTSLACPVTSAATQFPCS